MNAASARKRLVEIGGAARHEARHVAAAMLLDVPVVAASAIPQIDGDELVSLGHVNLGPESYTYEDVYNRALVVLVGELGDRDDWPPPHPSDPSMQGKAPAQVGNDGDRLWKAIHALGLDELQYDLLVHEARDLVKRRDFRQLEVGVTYLLEQGHTVGPELLERVRDITRQETKTAPASTETGDAGWFAVLADMRHADRDRVATGAFDRTIKRWQDSGEQIPLSWRDTPSFAHPVGTVDPSTLTDHDTFGPLFEGSIDLDGPHRAEARHAWTAVKANAVALELDYMVLASDEHDDTRTLEQLDITRLTLTPTHKARALIREADAEDLRELRRESDRVRIEIALAGIDRTPRAEPGPEVNAAPTVAELRRQAAACGIRLPPTHSERITLQYTGRASRW